MYNRYMRANLIGGWVESSLSSTPDPYLEKGLEDCYYDPRLMILPSDLPPMSALGLRPTTPSGVMPPNPLSEYLRRSAIQVHPSLWPINQSGNFLWIYTAHPTAGIASGSSHSAFRDIRHFWDQSTRFQWTCKRLGENESPLPPVNQTEERETSSAHLLANDSNVGYTPGFPECKIVQTRAPRWFFQTRRQARNGRCLPDWVSLPLRWIDRLVTLFSHSCSLRALVGWGLISPPLTPSSSMTVIGTLL